MAYKSDILNDKSLMLGISSEQSIPAKKKKMESTIIESISLLHKSSFSGNLR